MLHLNETFKNTLDFVAFLSGAAGFFFATVVPAMVGVCGLIWYGIRFYEYYESKKVKNGNQ